MKRPRKQSVPLDEDLLLAIGLIWGLVQQAQLEPARQLLRACLSVWPDDEHLWLMASLVQIELEGELDLPHHQFLRQCRYQAVAAVLLRRAAAFHTFIKEEHDHVE